MRVAALWLVLAAAPASGAPPAAAVQERALPPVVAPTPVTAPAAEQAPAAVSAPAPVAREPARASAPPASAAVRAAPSRPFVASQALIDKLGQGDRAFLAGDYRAALFAYQDAVYMAPQSAAARVKLGRAYLALRYPAQALAQAEQALASEPDNEDARRLREEAKSPPQRPAPAAAASSSGRGTPSGTAAASAPEKPHVYRLTPDPEGSGAPPEVAPAAAPPQREVLVVRGPATAPSSPPPDPAPAASATGTQAQVARGGTPAPAGNGDAAGRGAVTPAQHYRVALEMLSNREFQKAVGELSEAIAADPRLAVAWAARGSAQFGLGRYREASEDYRAALSLDESLGTPLYGLAECYRVLGDSAGAAEMYQRYANSGASDVRDDLRTIAAKRAQELR